MKLLLILLLSFPVYATDVSDWLEHENIREGVPAAYELCRNQPPSATITFSFKDGKVPSLLTVTCGQIIDHVKSKEPVKT